MTTRILEGAAVVEPAAPYRGFWMGGFEAADHINGIGVALDLATASGHADRLDEDHRRAAQAGLKCVRESIGWRLSEAAGGAIDLTRALRIAHSARRHGLQVLWTLMHYGLPDDLSLHDDALIPRLARFAGEVARVLKPFSNRPPVYTPVNEIGYLAWAASQPGLLHPPNNTPGNGIENAAESSRVSGYEVKRRLARAALAAMAAMRQEDPRARFLHVEPLVHVVPPAGRPEWLARAEEVASWQWQAWDLICGRAEPELGGRLDWLDLVGVNHYHSSQWELESEARLDWAGRDPRRRPFARLLDDAWQRYRRPLMVAETSHVGVGRAAWLHDMASQVRQALQAGVPVQGFCIYPLVDRPDWNEPARWHRSGLWHVETAVAVACEPQPSVGGESTALVEQPPTSARAAPVAALQRVAELAALRALQAWQQVLPTCPAAQAGEAPPLLVFSHLRWDFVRHRTRHLLEQLAGRFRIIYVEEPLYKAAPARLDHMVQGPHVDVLVPCTPLLEPGFCDAQQPWLQALLAPWLAQAGVMRPTAWLCTPMAWPLAQALQPAQVVYDCADELAGFWGAPAELPQREQALLAAADLVFAASTPLAAARAQTAGARLRLIANGVDAVFFRHPPGLGWAAEEARLLQAHVAGPRLGYAGVVDERFDLALLQGLAQARPQWQFIIVGPVVKIDPASLPCGANIHWLGGQPYATLPELMATWHIGLLPFVYSLATQHACPLKVLEYLAAGLPVVAADFPQWHRWRKAGVACSRTLEDHLQACEAALAEPRPQQLSRHRTARSLLRRCSWQSAATAAALAIESQSAVRRMSIEVDQQSSSNAALFPTARAAAWPLHPDRASAHWTAAAEIQEGV